MPGAPSYLKNPPKGSEFKRQLDYLWPGSDDAMLAEMEKSERPDTRKLADILRLIRETRPWRLPLRLARDHYARPYFEAVYGPEIIAHIAEHAPTLLDDMTADYCESEKRNAPANVRNKASSPLVASDETASRVAVIFAAVRRVRQQFPDAADDFVYREVAENLGLISINPDGRRHVQRGLVRRAEKAFRHVVGSTSGKLRECRLLAFIEIEAALENYYEHLKAKPSNVTKLDRAGIEQKRAAT